MAFFDIVALSALGGVVGFVWIALIRASVRGGCGTASCRIVTREADESDHQSELR